MEIPGKFFVRLQPSLAAALIAASLVISACAGVRTPGGSDSSAGGAIPVVAAENFYGDITRQLGGSRVAVTSILSDPNVDPHEYEANVQTGVEVANARLVIENGDGYDTWMDQLLSASPNPNRTVLVGSDLASRRLVDNPHVWYGVDNAQAIAQGIAAALEKLDPQGKSIYAANLSTFIASLSPIQQKLDLLKTKYHGTPVGLTETIFLYQTGPIGLAVLTPFEFQKAIAEGNDPPADSVVTANDQISAHQIKVLIYNVQTITPVTTHLQDEAKQAGIPVVAVSETMPAGKTYQAWMLDQLNALQAALGG